MVNSDGDISAIADYSVIPPFIFSRGVLLHVWFYPRSILYVSLIGYFWGQCLSGYSTRNLRITIDDNLLIIYLIFPRMGYNILFIRTSTIPNIRRIAIYLDPIIIVTSSYCAMCNLRAQINGTLRSMDLSVSLTVIECLRELRCLIFKRGFLII